MKHLLHRRRQVGRARLLYGFAQGIAGQSVSDEVAARAARLCRKALRVLPPTAAEREGASAVPSSGDLTSAELAGAVEQRLFEHSALHLLWRHRRVIARTTAVLLAVTMISIAAIPPLRRLVFPPNRATDKPWTASSAIPDFPLSGKMSGPARREGRFHTNDEPNPSVTVDLGKAFIISRVRAENRDDCCRERALPLAVEVGTDGRTWKRVGYRRALFDTWTATFAPTAARFVRLRVDRQSILHLRQVSVY